MEILRVFGKGFNMKISEIIPYVLNEDLEKLKNQFDNASEDIKLRFEDKVTKIQQGDDLLPTVMKVVKVFV